MFRAGVFISYVRAEADLLALGLGHSLKQGGFRVWLDMWCLRLGDSLLESFNRALTECSFGLVIITKSYMERPWTMRELGALLAREEDGKMKLFIVLHNVDDSYLKNHCPLLADRITLSTRGGIENVARELTRALVAAGHADYGLLNSYADLLARWDRVPGVRLAESGSDSIVVLQNMAVGILSAVLRTAKAAAQTPPLVLTIFALHLLWVLSNWLCMVVAKNLCMVVAKTKDASDRSQGLPKPRVGYSEACSSSLATCLIPAPAW